MKIYLFPICLLVFASCEKVIEIDLNSSSPKVVIEANLSDTNNGSGVRITQSLNYDQSNNFAPVSGAVVTIADLTAGTQETLTMDNHGVYTNPSLQGQVGHEYQLTVQVLGQTYTANSTMPQRVTFDSLTYKKQTFLGASAYQIRPRYLDPQGIGNSYRFVLFKNRRLDKTIFVDNDEFLDGQQNERPLFTRDAEFKANDTITVEMQTISAAIYRYYNALDQASSGNSSAPANPPTNISGGALGYFSTRTSQLQSVILR